MGEKFKVHVGTGKEQTQQVYMNAMLKVETVKTVRTLN